MVEMDSEAGRGLPLKELKRQFSRLQGKAGDEAFEKALAGSPMLRRLADMIDDLKAGRISPEDAEA